MPKREVFYLLRGKHKEKIKIILVHGSFFETVSVSNLISQSFEQVLKERLEQKNLKLDDNIKNLLVDTFSTQESFSKVKNVDKSSVKLRFRIMTEVKAEGNILNTKKYPEIKDNTINLIISRRSTESEILTLKRFSSVYSKNEIAGFRIFNIKHHLNGYFTVFQQDI